MLKGIANTNGVFQVPYTGATTDVDLGVYNLTAKALLVAGTSGAGKLNLKHQAEAATATGTATAIFADTNGDLRTKNSIGYYTTYKTSLNTADRVYTFQNKTHTIADAADVTALAFALVLPKSVTPVTILSSNSRAVYTNEGATALGVFNLPAAEAGLINSFIIQDADGIKVNAATGNTIRIGSSVSGAAGYITATTIGNAVTLVAINATEWVAINAIGTWTVV